MRNKTFYNIDHANMYLADSIILYDGKPIKVLNVWRESRKTYISYKKLYYTYRESNEHKIELSDPKIDMTPVKLGFVNSNLLSLRGAIATFRSPYRQYKIGLSRNNIIIIPPVSVRDADKLLYSRGMYNTICDKFPTFRKASIRAKDKGVNVAFSRRFKVSPNQNIFYIHSGQTIGQIIHHRETSLHNDFGFFYEQLEQDKQE